MQGCNVAAPLRRGRTWKTAVWPGAEQREQEASQFPSLSCMVGRMQSNTGSPCRPDTSVLSLAVVRCSMVVTLWGHGTVQDSELAGPFD